ncbi:MAG: M20 family metallopeptidase [Aristaeellaceae bacterium]
MDIMKLVREQYPYAVMLRRRLHAYPEAAPEEQLHTMAAIESELDTMGIEHLRVDGGGVLGMIHGSRPGKTLLMRADMDGLRIQESPCNLKGPRTCISLKPGLMHACGHDAHTAMLLAQARILRDMARELSGRIILMFEEGEEGGGNIKRLCRYLHESGMQLDGCYATHVRWDIPTGRIGLCDGMAMCGQMRFRLTLEGRSGHGSRPDLACNAIDCFHLIYAAWQTLRMTHVRPDTSLTWSVCSLHAGDSHNVIPDRLTCEGTIRMADMPSGDAFWQAFLQTALRTAEQCGCRAELTRPMFLLPLQSEPACQGLFRQAVAEHLGEEVTFLCEPWMASESFSYLSAMYPSVFSFVGIRNEQLGSGANHHTPAFDLDEEGMLTGMAAAVAYAQAFLTTPPDTAGFVPLCRDMAALLDMVEQQPGQV